MYQNMNMIIGGLYSGNYDAANDTFALKKKGNYTYSNNSNESLTKGLRSNFFCGSQYFHSNSPGRDLIY